MKITIANVNGNQALADKNIKIILTEATKKLEQEGLEIEDVKLEELSATYTFKAKGQADYSVASVEHSGLTEMYEIDFDLAENVKADNEAESNYSEDEKEIVRGGTLEQFEEIGSVYEEEDLTLDNIEDYGDLVLGRYTHKENGHEVVRVLQKDKQSGQYRLIQEYTIKEKIEQK